MRGGGGMTKTGVTLHTSHLTAATSPLLVHVSNAHLVHYFSAEEITKSRFTRNVSVGQIVLLLPSFVLYQTMVCQGAKYTPISKSRTYIHVY